MVRMKENWMDYSVFCGMYDIKVYHGECLEVMDLMIEDNYLFDMILCDLPYGTTQNKWDSVIPLEQLWIRYEKLIKPNGAIVLTSAEPFTSALVMSNTKLFRYDIIWEKQKGSDPLNANRKPLRSHENILVFYKKQPTYNPQFTEGAPYLRKGDCKVKSSNFNEAKTINDRGSSDGKRYPKTVVKFTSEGMNSNNLHPTQKPVELLKYLIETYTKKGDKVLDNCSGSGSTAVACLETERSFVGIELDKKYMEISNRRLTELMCDKRDREFGYGKYANLFTNL